MRKKLSKSWAATRLRKALRQKCSSWFTKYNNGESKSGFCVLDLNHNPKKWIVPYFLRTNSCLVPFFQWGTAFLFLILFPFFFQNTFFLSELRFSWLIFKKSSRCKLVIFMTIWPHEFYGWFLCKTFLWKKIGKRTKPFLFALLFRFLIWATRYANSLTTRRHCLTS